MQTSDPETMNPHQCSQPSNLIGQESTGQKSMKLGKFYFVRCLRATWSRDNKPEWTPVIGPPHDDLEHIGFKHQHFHVDSRFLGKRTQNRTAENQHKNRKINLAFVLPISHVIPIGSKGKLKLDDKRLEDFPEESYMRTMKLKFKTECPEYNFKPPWLLSMEKAYRNARLSPDMMCPHRGADLNGMKTDENGLLTCPLHGLRWDTQTGKLSPRATPEEAAFDST